MSRVRPAFAAACLVALVFATLPTPLTAQRDAQPLSASVAAEPMGGRLVGSFLSWGRSALSWLQAIIATEHGAIVQTPVVPPTP